MTDNVVELSVVTTLDIPVERVLRGANKQDLAHVIVIGEHADGTLFFASSRSSGPATLWEIERAKHALLHMGGAMS